MIRVRRFAIPLLALTLFAAGCGDDDPETTATTEEPAAETSTPTPEATEAPAADLKDTETKPVIAKPSGDPPAELVKEDIVTGKGKTAKKGSQLTMQYVGVSFSTGEEFDASWDRGEPFQFELGGGQVIAGWDEGIVGMKEGGRRRLTIPPDMGYGPAGSPPAIGPNETLIFIVDLVEVS
jgi:peptidylprolyl isomerase